MQRSNGKEEGTCSVYMPSFDGKVHMTSVLLYAVVASEEVVSVYGSAKRAFTSGDIHQFGVMYWRDERSGGLM
jgi:hypothetical protein